MSLWSSLRNGAATYHALVDYFRTPLRSSEVEAIVRRRLEAREDRFVLVVKEAIYDEPASPYRVLLREAGCEFADLARAVRESGVEGALRRLHESGVYVTFDEFKGNVPIRRFGREIPVHPEAFDNPLLTPQYTSRTSGTRSGAIAVPISLDTLAEQSADVALSLRARGVGTGGVALWFPTYPAAGLNNALRFAKAGIRIDHWFTQVDPRRHHLSSKHRLFTRLVHLAAWRTGIPIPAPRTVELREASRVAAWIAQTTRRGVTPVLRTFVSSAVRVAEVAVAQGIDIAGARFFVGGESLTRSRRQLIAASGALPIPAYASTETGPIGHGCLADAQGDALHLFADLHALVTRRRLLEAGGGEVDAFLLTTLSPHASKVLLNVELGDCGAVEPAACGCALHRAGLTTILRDIQSFEKLTSEGMTLLGADFVDIVERLLPARFGGTLADYQIVEAEDPAGLLRLNILVSPRVGAVEPEEVVRVFLAELRGRRPKSSIVEMWGQASTVRVLRETPRLTRGGKLLPFYALGTARAQSEAATRVAVGPGRPSV